MKKLLLATTLFSTILLAEESSFFGNSFNSASKYWEITKKASIEAWNDSNDTRKLIMDNANVAWEQTKKYSNTAKIIAMEQALLNGLNLAIETEDIKVLELKIDEHKTDKIDIIVKLNGEDENLTISIDSFDWSKSEDKRYIYLSNIKFNMNISWIEHIFNYYLKANNGYIKLPYSISRESVLFTIKSQLETIDKDIDLLVSKEWEDKKIELFDLWTQSDKKDLSTVVNKIYDNKLISVEKFIVKDENLNILINLDDNTTKLILNTDNFEWGFSQDKQFIIIKNIFLDSCNKPWLMSLITKPKTELRFRYTDIMSNILQSIKPKVYFK